MITTHILLDFKRFFTRLKYSPEDEYFIKNHNTIFNHDMDLGGDVEALKLRYYNRIKNFDEMIQSEKNVMFIQSLANNEDVDNLYRVLKYKRRNKPFKLVIIDMGYGEPVVKKHRKEITVVRNPIPYKDYIWYLKSHKYSDVGQKFEKDVIDKVKELI